MSKLKRFAAIFAVLICLAVICLGCAGAIQKGTLLASPGAQRVRIVDGTISGKSWRAQAEDVYYRMYIPESATPETPAPAVLLLHGYQNDNQTCAAYAVELSRRGYVVMAIDEYGHGKTKTGLLARGFVNHKVTTNYGLDSAKDGTFTEISGQDRYKLLMNFSNLSFFLEKYTLDGDENHGIWDSSAGGIYAYRWLAGVNFVDPARMAVSGHSMGTWSSWTVAAAFAGTAMEPRATVLQCGELFTKDAHDNGLFWFNNVLLLQAKYDEFSCFRDYKNNVNDELLKSPLRTEFLGTTADEAAWNTTFGKFENGSARRMQLLNTNHRLTTHNKEGLATAIDWIDQATGHNSPIASTDQVMMVREWLIFAAMLLVIASLLPLMELLLMVAPLKGAAQPLPEKTHMKSNKKWWIGAAITMAIAFATYPFCTQLGHGLFPLPENIFRMTIGDGFLVWYLICVIIMLAFLFIGRAKAKSKAKKAGVEPDLETLHEMGLATAEEPDKFGWGLLLRSAVLVLLLVFFMYVMVEIAETVFGLDLRFIWPFFKSFSGERFLQFLVYFPMFALFFVLNNSKIMASSRQEATYQKGAKGFFGTWWRVALMMVGGVCFVVLLEYIPFFAGIGPGADVLFGSTFGGPFMSLLIVFVPQVLVFSLLGTYIYRRTGNVFTSALLISSLACWIVTGGSSML